MSAKRSRRHDCEQSLVFPEYVIGNILSRLPVKRLLRFKRVSKSWLSLIDSKWFIKIHLQHAARNTNFRRRFDDKVCFNLPESFHILGCCNGLAIILKKTRFFLWNPTTMISMEIPQIADGEIDKHATWKYGFGWDESSCAHKVLVIWPDCRDWYCKVYNSNTNSWKAVKKISYCKSMYFCGKGQFVCGKLHWLRTNVYVGGWEVPDVLTFDLKTEEFGTMKLPWPCHLVACLGVLGEYLCAVSYNDERTHIDVWVMKHGECWVGVTDLLVYEPYRRIRLAAHPCVGRSFEVLLVRGSNFLVCNAREDVESWLEKIRVFLTANDYVESLVSPITKKENV